MADDPPPPVDDIAAVNPGDDEAAGDQANNVENEQQQQPAAQGENVPLNPPPVNAVDNPLNDENQRLEPPNAFQRDAQLRLEDEYDNESNQTPLRGAGEQSQEPYDGRASLIQQNSQFDAYADFFHETSRILPELFGLNDGRARGEAATALERQNMARRMDMYAELANIASNAAASTAKVHQKRQSFPLITELPQAGAFGTTSNLDRVKHSHIVAYNPLEKKVGISCLAWLQKVTSLAKSHKLTGPTTIELLKIKSDGPAFDSIRHMQRDGYSLIRVVESLEKRYGGVCLPQVALRRCAAMILQAGENLSDFQVRLREMAFIAAKAVPRARQEEREQEITRTNFYRVLPAEIRRDLEHAEDSRALAGDPEWDLTELLAQTSELYQKFAERRQSEQLNARVALRAPITNQYGGKVFLVAPEEAEPDAEDEGTPSLDSATLETYQADPEDELIQTVVEEEDQSDNLTDQQEMYDEIAYFVGQRFPNRFTPRGPAAVARGGIQRGYQRGAFRGRGTFGPRFAGNRPLAQPRQYQAVKPGEGPPGLLSNLRPPIPANAIPALANCLTGCCLRCGREGHAYRDPICPLVGRPLMSKPCIRCKVGLHTVGDCVRPSNLQMDRKP